MGKPEREAAIENPEFAAELIDDCRPFFERGQYEFGVVAVQRCVRFGLPIPDWIEEEVCAAIEFYFEKGGSTGRGKGGGHKVRSRRARIEVMRYQAVERELARGLNREEAFVQASIILRSTLGRGSATTVGRSYDAIARTYRRERRRPGPKPKSSPR